MWPTYMHIYIYTHIHIYIYIHIHIHIYIHIHMYIFIYIYYINKYTYIHTYIHTYLHTYIPTYLHAYIPTCLHAYMPTCLHAYMPTYLHTYIPTYLHTYIPTYLHTYIPTYLHTYIPTYLHTYIPTCLHAYMPTYLHTYIPTYLHTYIPTYLHTYIPTYLQTYRPTYLHTYILYIYVHGKSTFFIRHSWNQAPNSRGLEDDRDILSAYESELQFYTPLVHIYDKPDWKGIMIWNAFNYLEYTHCCDIPDLEYVISQFHARFRKGSLPLMKTPWQVRECLLSGPKTTEEMKKPPAPVAIFFRGGESWGQEQQQVAGIWPKSLGYHLDFTSEYGYHFTKIIKWIWFWIPPKITSKIHWWPKMVGSTPWPCFWGDPGGVRGCARRRVERFLGGHEAYVGSMIRL